MAAAGRDWQIADFVDDKQGVAAQIADPLAQLAVTLNLGKEAMISAKVEKCTLRPALTASTASAEARCVLPVPDGPRRWTTSARSRKVNSGPTQALPTDDQAILAAYVADCNGATNTTG